MFKTIKKHKKANYYYENIKRKTRKIQNVAYKNKITSREQRQKFSNTSRFIA